MTLRMRFCLLAAAAMFVAALVTSDAQKFRSGALGIRVDVLVTDGSKPVTGLTTEDFELRDEGVVQTVSVLDVEQLPLNVILAFDTSSSMAGSRLTSLVAAARALLGGLRDVDRTALLTFSGRVRLLAPLTPSRMQLMSALDRVQASGTTALRDAAFTAVSLPESEDVRTLVLIFSDGADTASWLTEEKVIEAAKASDAVVYPVRVRRLATVPAGDAVLKDKHGFLMTPLEPPRTKTIDLDSRNTFVADLAAATGGRVMYADADIDLRSTFAQTLDEFRNRYVLSYTPTGVSATGWHRVEVRLKAKKGKVSARRGYFAELPPSR
jgi:VWFA-related protein